MKEKEFVRRKKCKLCEKGLRGQNKSGYCWSCYIIVWKQGHKEDIEDEKSSKV